MEAAARDGLPLLRERDSQTQGKRFRGAPVLGELPAENPVPGRPRAVPAAVPINPQQPRGEPGGARVTRAARRRLAVTVHRQPRPTHGPVVTWKGGPPAAAFEGGRGGGEAEGGRESFCPGAGEAGSARFGYLREVCTWGDEGARACDKAPAAGEHGGPASRWIDKRPSDRRSPGRNPGPQGAFEMSMINVSCNSH